MAASKFLHDTDTEEASCNSTWALNFDIDLKTLNILEIRFFSALNWNLFVSRADFDKFLISHLVVPTAASAEPRSKSKRRRCDSTAKRISNAHFNQKRMKSHTKFRMAKVNINPSSCSSYSTSFIGVENRILNHIENNIINTFFSHYFRPWQCLQLRFSLFLTLACIRSTTKLLLKLSSRANYLRNHRHHFLTRPTCALIR